MAADTGISVRPLWTRCVAQELKSAGANADAALAEAGLEWRQLDRTDGWIPFVRHAELLEIASRELKNDHYGLTLAQRVDVRDGDILAYLGVASDTIETALRNMARYSRIVSEAFQADLELDGGSGMLKFAPQQPSFTGYRQAAEFRLGLVTMACRHFTGQRVSPNTVHFIHERHGGLEEFARFFGCPVKFGQELEQIAFSRKALTTPITSADHRLLAILRNYADEILRSRPQPRPDFTDQIERRLTELLANGEARVKVVAEEFGMSERTLVRRLAQQNTSFADIVDRLRHDLARKYLGDENLSLTQIAFLLGYSSQSAFSAACRRWTGKTPRELRTA